MSLTRTPLIRTVSSLLLLGRVKADYGAPYRFTTSHAKGSQARVKGIDCWTNTFPYPATERHPSQPPPYSQRRSTSTARRSLRRSQCH